MQTMMVRARIVVDTGRGLYGSRYLVVFDVSDLVINGLALEDHQDANQIVLHVPQL